MMEEDEYMQYIKNLVENEPEMINELEEDENGDLMSPLMTALFDGNHQAVSLLLEYEHIDINMRNEEGHAAYFYCINPLDHESVSEQSKLQCLRLLLETGVQNLYRVHEAHNFTPLMIAAKRCDDVCLAEIIKAGYSNNENVVPVHNFDIDSEDEILFGNNYYLSFFDDCHFNDEDDDDDGILIGDYTNIMDIKKRMVDFHTYCHVYKKIWKTSIDFWDFGNRKTALELCLKARNVPVEKQLACIKLLVEAKASYIMTDVDGYQLKPIKLAIGKYYAVDPSIIKYLISIGCHLDEQKDFERAVCYMHLEIVQLLIKEGIDPHSLNTNRNILHSFFMWDNLDYFEHYEVYEKMKKMLRFLVQELKLDINTIDDDGVSLFSLVFLYFIKGISFPFLYLMSENINTNILTNDRELKNYHSMFRTARVCVLSFKEVDHYKLLYEMGIPFKLNCKLHDRFLGKNEPSENTLKWLEEISSKPDSLLKSCKLTIRKLLGRDIKFKISQLRLPNALKNMILLKDILPEECFEY